MTIRLCLFKMFQSVNFFYIIIYHKLLYNKFIIFYYNYFKIVLKIIQINITCVKIRLTHAHTLQILI